MRKKARVLAAYETRLAEYETANSERKRLNAAGDLAGVAIVSLKNNKKIPKTRPRKPPILTEPYTPKSYQEVCTMPTNCLIAEDGYILATELVRCRLCVMIVAQLVEDEDEPPKRLDFMCSTLLPDHEEKEHYARQDDPHGSKNGSYPCDACLNRLAIDIKAKQNSLQLFAELRARTKKISILVYF
ncbi:hypothetical protein C8R44DRAFT_893279 [Mycena epipterygia]|nr:hypothetical protein C8R44DRAFT_893279 [Mycena epipterygia]